MRPGLIEFAELNLNQNITDREDCQLSCIFSASTYWLKGPKQVFLGIKNNWRPNQFMLDPLLNL
jgi:hypothetical protein